MLLLLLLLTLARSQTPLKGWPSLRGAPGRHLLAKRAQPLQTSSSSSRTAAAAAAWQMAGTSRPGRRISLRSLGRAQQLTRTPCSTCLPSSGLCCEAASRGKVGLLPLVRLWVYLPAVAEERCSGQGATPGCPQLLQG